MEQRTDVNWSGPYRLKWIEWKIDQNIILIDVAQNEYSN